VCVFSVNGLSSVTSCQTVNDVRVMPSSCVDGCSSYLSVCSPRLTSSMTVNADCCPVQTSSCCRHHHRHHHHHHHQSHYHHHHGNHVNHYQQPVSYRPVFHFVSVVLLITSAKEYCDRPCLLISLRLARSLLFLSLTLSVCPSVCHNHCFFFLFLDGIETFLAVSSPCGTLQNVVLRFLI